MLASLLASGIWLQIATYFGLPVSTTHAIVGAIVGFGAVVGGMDAVHWDNVAYIACSWIASPLLGAACAFGIFSLLRTRIFYHPEPFEATKKALPWIVAAMIIVLSSVSLWNVIAPGSSFVVKSLIILVLGSIGSALTYLFCKWYKMPNTIPVTATPSDPYLLESLEKAKKYLVRAKGASRGELNFHLDGIVQEVEGCRQNLAQQTNVEYINQEFHWVEKTFGVLQIVSASLMAFSHGANDVANAMGPLAAIISIVSSGTSNFQAQFPTWILAVGGTGIVIGLATWGWRVIETIGKKITELTPSRGFSAEFGAAFTVLLASRFGFPISTTHTLVGAVLGVGLAGGLGSLNLRVLRDIILAWFVTIPVGAGLSILCYYIISSI